MEETIRIGDGGEFGLLARAGGQPNGLCVVLFNAGLIHRSGPQRFYVELARRLAGSGFDAFRFDLPGIGDNAMEGAASPQAVVQRVFDLLQAATGARGFIVGGICSAADLGWRAALADPRVRGLVLVDPMAVKGRWHRIGKLQMALRSPPWRWPGKLLRKLRPAPTAAGGPAIEDYRDWPAPDEFERQAGDLLARGVRILALYTGGVADYLLHPGQIDQTFGAARRHPGLRVEFEPGLDHIFFAAVSRRRAVASIADWAGRVFGPVGSIG